MASYRHLVCVDNLTYLHTPLQPGREREREGERKEREREREGERYSCRVLVIYFSQFFLIY